MKPSKSSALSPPCAGWISFQRSQANSAPLPPQREGEPVLDRGAEALVGQPAAGLLDHAAVAAGVGMMLPVKPTPERVEGRQQDAQADPLAEREEIVPERDHVGHEAADRLLEIAVAHLRVLQHQPQAGDAAVLEVAEIGLDRRPVALAVQSLEVDPADAVVLPDRRPGLAALGDEIGGVFRHADPGHRRDRGPAEAQRQVVRHARAGLVGRSVSLPPMPGSWCAARRRRVGRVRRARLR